MATVEQTANLKCTKCKAPISDSDSYCPKCGLFEPQRSFRIGDWVGLAFVAAFSLLMSLAMGLSLVGAEQTSNVLANLAGASAIVCPAIAAVLFYFKLRAWRRHREATH